MKELSIEQKAKRYDKALEKSKRLYEQGTITESLAYIFPELKKSEDEKIRKDLIIYLRSILSNKKYGDKFIEGWIAWLEKQGEKIDIANKEYWRGYREGKQEILDKYYELEKQGEQKPADKVEPKFKVKYADSEYNVLEVKDIAGVTFYGIEDEPNHIDYVKADNCEIISGYGIKEIGLSFPTKPVMFSEQKPAWSEEDKEMLEDTCRILSNSKECTTSNVRWLKSLKDRYAWKPSDEQMITLRHVISGCSYDIEPLVELETKLKEL